MRGQGGGVFRFNLSHARILVHESSTHRPISFLFLSTLRFTFAVWPFRVPSGVIVLSAPRGRIYETHRVQRKRKKKEREGEVVSNNERSIEGKTFIAEERRLKREKSGSVSRRKLLCRSKIIIRGTL